MRFKKLKGVRKPSKKRRIAPRAERKHVTSRRRRFDTRGSHARRYDLWPGAWSKEMGGHPWSRVELRIATTRFWMLREAWLLGSHVAGDGATQGCVISHLRSHVRGKLSLTRGPRGRIATVLLNEVDLLLHPSEIGAHEMTHAAMRFLDFRDIRLTGGMVEEEALCYTVGELVRQLNCIFYAHSYRRPQQ